MILTISTYISTIKRRFVENIDIQCNCVFSTCDTRFIQPSSSINMAPILGYWNLRGFVDPICFLLAHVDVDYEYKSYSIGPAPEYAKDEFRSTKAELGLDFPNLPYYIDGDFKLSQRDYPSLYGTKYELVPTKDAEITRCDLAEQVTKDIRIFMFRAWATNDEAAKKDIANWLPGKLEQFNKFLGSGPFILGEKITYADFYLYTILDYIRLYNSKYIENHSSLQNFPAKIEARPGVQAYIKSDKFSRLPIAGPQYGWGGQA